MNLLDEQAGKHFDPALVQLFHDILPDVLAVKAKQTDLIKLEPIIVKMH